LPLLFVGDHFVTNMLLHVEATFSDRICIYVPGNF
jgi:hypothetical protein